MIRMITAAVAALALTGTMAITAEASSNGQQDLMQKVSNSGWWSRVNSDRDAYAYGTPDGYAGSYVAQDDGYGERPIYRRAHRPMAPIAPYGYGGAY